MIAIGIVLIVSVFMTPMSGHVLAKSKDSKAKSAIIKAIGKAVEGKYSTIKLIQLSKSNVSGYVTVYNTTKSGSTPIPIPPPVPPNPNPNPVPTGPTTKVCLVGDLKGSTVPNLMKDCNLKIGLGDLGYASDLSYFKGLKFDKCVVGNHDSPEDGSSSIYKEALAYCGDHWTLKIGTSTLMIGLNTNGDSTEQLTAAKQALSQNSQAKTVILVSHKNGHVFPNAHHPAEAKSLYNQIEALISPSISLYEISGHNHDNAAAPAKHWYIAGAGGKSFYTCGQDSDWTFCDNTHVGYLELTIDNTNGNTAAKFIK
jgi:hypothetical protein